MTSPSPHSSQHLLAGVSGGDTAAETAVVDRFRARLLALVRRQLGRDLQPRFDEEDVVQSAFRTFFFRAAEGRFVCERPGDLWRLLSTISLNKLRGTVAEQRAAKRDVRRESRAPDLSGYVPVDFADVATATPSQYAAAAEELNVIARTERDRAVLEHRLVGRTEPEIAEQLGIAERTVRRDLVRLREQAERRLAALGAGWASAEPITNAATIDERDFTLHEMVGAGGIGRVFRATLKSSGEVVAVKFLRKAAARSEFVVGRFRDEIGHLSELEHPGILRVRGSGRSRSGLPFFVTDWCPGGDLTQHAGHCSRERALTWVRQVAEAIQFAHDRGIVHCDLKPGNVLLDGDGNAVVGDFGHAVRPRVDARPLGGTRAYLAPELVASTTTPVDARVDVYGIGTVLLGLMADRLPADGIANPSDGEDWQTVVARCLATEPADRFATVDELLEALPN